MSREESIRRPGWWPGLSELTGSLRRKRWQATVLGAVMGSAAAVAVWVALPHGLHEVRALLQIKPDPTPSGQDTHFGEYRATQERLIQTRTLYERVAADPTVSQALAGYDDPAHHVQAITRLRWESPELLAVTMTGDDPAMLLTAVETLLAEYLRDSVTEDGVSRLRQRHEIEEMIAALGQDVGRPAQEVAETRTALRQELLRLELAETAGPRVLIREAAVLSEYRNLARKMMSTVVAFAGGWLAAVVAVTLIEWRRQLVISADQLTRRLGLPVLGVIPPHGEGQGPVAELDAVRTALIHRTGGDNALIVAVSAVTAGDRTAEPAYQLAASLAGVGLRTLLVDAGLGAPLLHEYFGMPRSPGLGELLLQESDVSEAVRPAADPNLWLLPGGERSDRVMAAITQGTSVASLFDRLRRQFDFVLIGTGPVKSGSESTLLARHLDGSILVARQYTSRLPEVRGAAETLRQFDHTLYGLVLCGVSAT